MLSGHNWWCSLFPSLCFSDISNGKIDESSKENFQKNLDDEEMNILFKKTPKIQFKFKIIEFFNK